MIKVLIADDHTMFVDGIESILGTEPDITIVGKCFDGKSVFHILHTMDVDVVLLDINLPDMSGIEVCERLTAEHKGVKVLGLSMYNDASFITALIENGAMGYILKNTGKAELVNAIKVISRGQTYFSDEVTQTIMRGLVSNRKGSDRAPQAAPIVSRREKEVLALIVKEYTTTEIAEALNISLKTVESHRRSLLTKLNVRNTAGLVRVAVEQELVNV